MPTGQLSAPEHERAAVVADDGSGRAVGTAAYVRVYGRRAELTLEVDDAWWPRGVPERLVAELCEIAARHGIATFLARVPPGDTLYRTLLVERFAAREEPCGERVDLAIATDVVPAPRCVVRTDAIATSGDACAAGRREPVTGQRQR